MRLEAKIGIVVGIVIVALGGLFFVTRDSGSGPAAAAPNAGANNPSNTNSSRQGSPLPGERRHEPAPTGERPTPPREAPEPSLGTAHQPPNYALDGPRGGELPGIRASEPPPPTEDAHEPRIAEAPTTQPSPTEVVRSTWPPAPTPTLPSVRGPGETIERPEPAVAPAPAPQTHVIQRGDTIAGLASKYLGSEKYTRLLLEANPQITDPRKIQIGDRITIPPKPAEATAPAAAHGSDVGTSTPPVARRELPRREQPADTKPYVVRQGDSWAKIAGWALGDSSRWTELFEMNKRSPAEHWGDLRPGETIYVPTTAKLPESRDSSTLMRAESRD